MQPGTSRPFPFDAVLFDLDGVIIDTAALHYRVWDTFARARGYVPTQAELLATNGRRGTETLQAWFGPGLTEDDIASLTHELDARVQHQLATEPVSAVPGVHRFLEDLRRAGVPWALGTSATAANAELALSRLGLGELFPVRVTAADVVRGKPDPPRGSRRTSARCPFPSRPEPRAGDVPPEARHRQDGGPAASVRATMPDFSLARGPLLLVLLMPAAASAATLTVGPGKTYATPSAAAAAARDGDIIELSTGDYRDEAIWTANGLTIRGVGGGRAHLDAAGLTLANRKAIWVIQGSGTTVENIEFSGASVPDQNGAGIRQEGSGLTVRNCSFHDNENGLLAGDKADSDILIESSWFARNGAGDGQSHNMYINHVRSFTLRFSYSQGAKVGHLVKSRAYSTSILYNRLTGEEGNPSYEIDLPNGGRVEVVGNQIQQGTTTENPTLLTFGEEGTSNPEQTLLVLNNTFVNDRTAGGTFVRIAGSPTARIINNLFIGAGTPISGTATQQTNLVTDGSGLVDAANFDYHLKANSPAINAGTDPGTDGTQSLAPQFQYVHPLGSEPRQPVDGAWDVGAFEYGTPPSDVPGVPGTGCGCTTSGTASSALTLLLLLAWARRRTV